MRNLKKIKRLLPVIILVSIVHCKTNSLAQSAPARGVNLDRYVLVKQEDFNGIALDTTFWNYRQENMVRGFAKMLRSNIQLTGDGFLRIFANRSGNTFSAGQISTEKTFLQQYGYFECRAKVNGSIGPHCALWLQSPDNGATLDPAKDGVEIDIFEYHRAEGREFVYHNLHWNGYGSQHKTLGSRAEIPGMAEGFHTFGLEWTPNEYIAYVDGVEKARTSTAISHRSEFLVLSMDINGYGGDHLKGIYPDFFEVDYVKVYALKN